jgi:hypothetical protein
VYVGVNGCPAGNCTANQLTPYMGDAAFEEVVWDAVGGLYIPFDACYPPGYTPPIAALAPDCIYAVGVWPRPGGRGSYPGVGVDPATYRLTLSTPTGTQRIPQDCPGSGRVCTLPMQAVNPQPALRFYEGYASSNSQVGVTVAISAQLCYGTSITLYACDVTVGSCATPDRPSPRNADYTLSLSSSAAETPSTLVMPPWVAGGDVYFFSVGATGGTQPPLDVPTYELSIQHGTGVVMQLAQGGTQMTGTWNGNAFTITWTLPVLVSGTLPYPPMSNAVFLIDTFLYGSTGTSMHLSSPCGIRYARFQNLTGAQSVFVRQADACGTSNTCSYTINWLPNPVGNPSVTTSWVALTAVCGASPASRYSSGPCMPANQESQSLAWTPILDNPVAPTPLPSPTSSNTPSVSATPSITPSPSYAPGGGGAAPAPKSNGAAVAASVVVVLLLLLGGGGFAAWKFGYGATAYTRLSQMMGGDDRGSSSKAREVLAAHPIFGGSGGEGGEASSDYTALS